ncbi:MAG TPA: DUF3501 family protein [Acidimicrobiales bacterium]|nr:DUF3501 family protein [Acidimicrobiales bacterium]
MSALTLADIVDLRAYERQRPDFLRQVIELKKIRRVPIGPLVTVVFENRTTIRFQIQEMARAERMSTDEQVQGELDVYNALVPGPGELCLTLFIELTTEADLRQWLPRLVGIERSVELRLGHDPVRVVTATVDADHAAQLTREEVTASVHYVRFRLDGEERRAFEAGPVALAITHEAYAHATLLSAETRRSLVGDWTA